MTMHVSMDGPCAGRTITYRMYIRQTALKHKHITKYLPAVHALMYAIRYHMYLFRMGKATPLKVLMGGHRVIELGQQGADTDKLISEATEFSCFNDCMGKDLVL